MYTVLVAEDEPLALKNICSIVEKYCPEYRVIATARDGASALEKIRQVRPDVVVSDIKMPRPTGVEIAEILHEEMPQTCFIITSGYDDFAFTQSAIRSGVTDYLLKPITPSALKQSLELASGRLRLAYYQERNRILRMLGRSESVGQGDLQRYLPDEAYYGILLRANGLPRRFSIDRKNEVYSDMEERIIVFGRDEMEFLFLVPAELMTGQYAMAEFLEKLRKQADNTWNQASKRAYYTLLYDSGSFPREDLATKVHTLYKTLRMVSTVGRTQILDITGQQEYDTLEPLYSGDGEADAALKRMEWLAKSGGTDILREEIKKAYALSAQRRMPQLWVEHFTRDLFSLLRRIGRLSLPLHEQEYLLDDIFYNAASAENLSESILSLLFDGEATEPEESADSRILFERIAVWLERHMREPLSVQDICGAFGVSQSHLSRLFRKYTARSCNKYLIELRIRRARELLRDNPYARIRDVAEMVGYSDPLYFSRVFRSYVGKSPSDYVNELLLPSAP